MSKIGGAVYFLNELERTYPSDVGKNHALLCIQTL